MDALYLGEGRGREPVLADAGNIEQPFFLKLIPRVEQPLFPFGMRGRNGPVKGREKDDAQTAARFQRRDGPDVLHDDLPFWYPPRAFSV